MATQRTPIKTPMLLNTTPPDTYDSDLSVNISSADKENNEFRTNVTKRIKRKMNENPGSSSMDSSMSEIKLMFSQIKTQQDTLLTKNEEIQKSIDFMSSKYDEMLSKMNILETKNKEYKKQIAVLENKLDNLEKNVTSTSIEIRNIPKLNKENECKQTLTRYLNDIVKAVGIQAEVPDAEIRDVYRKKKSESIVVDFVNTSIKENIMMATKKFNKINRSNNKPQLNSTHIKLTCPNRPIYVMEVLTEKNRKLSFLARGMVKDKKVLATWSSYGRIFVRKREGDVPIKISSEEDLLGL